MHALGEVDRDGCLASELAGGAEVFKGRSLRIGVVILAGGRDVENRGVGGEPAEDGAAATMNSMLYPLFRRARSLINSRGFCRIFGRIRRIIRPRGLRRNR